MKKAIVTGASSGIGMEIAEILGEKGYYVILVARREDKLKSVLGKLKCGGEIFPCDLSVTENCIKLHETYKNDNIEVLVNNAGFGIFGKFSETGLSRDLEMINLNISSLHALTKLFLGDMLKKDKGYILNVASLASFMSGPLMGAYYASTAYVTRLSRAISKEIKGSKVRISVLCPGPVDTEFNNVAGVKFALKPLSAKKVADLSVKKMFKGKFYILPGTAAKFTAFFSKLIPDTILSECSMKIQKKKIKV
ncbi:MAG: SDR family oxidoreductase [Clostridia bacterium]|nr:SDR family oxidoreductase [Clostridia bacterium]